MGQFDLRDPALWDRLPEMHREELTACLAEVRAALDRLDEKEPADMESDAYERWASRHEPLEDLADELLDRLDGAI